MRKPHPYILYDVDYFGVCLAKCAIKYKAPDTICVGGFVYGRIPVDYASCL